MGSLHNDIDWSLEGNLSGPDGVKVECFMIKRLFFLIKKIIEEILDMIESLLFMLWPFSIVLTFFVIVSLSLGAIDKVNWSFVSKCLPLVIITLLVMLRRKLK